MTKHALIVDDSKTACRTLAALLDKHGIHSTSVYSAEAALEELQLQKPDVIFMDQSMPGMDGLETVKIIKGNPDTATIPVLMYTAKEGDVYLGQARALGALDVLPKGQLREKLDEALDKLHINTDEEETIEGSAEAEATVQAAGEHPAPRPMPQRSANEIHRDTDLRRQLQSLRSELTRQLYMVLTEEQISQKEYARWLLESMDKKLNERVTALEESLTDQTERQATEVHSSIRKRQRFLLGACALIAAACVTLVWQLGQLDGERAALQSSLDDISGQMTALQESAGGAGEAAGGGGDGGNYRLGIVGATGEPVGVLLGMDDSGQYFAALSQSDYVFHVNPTGEVGIPLEQRYFAAPNCNGQPLVSGQAGVLYRDASDGLWYTPKDTGTTSVRPSSTLDLTGQCEPIDAAQMPLRPLRANDPEITGVGINAEPLSLVKR